MVKKVCVICLKVFANKSNLNKHTKTVHRTHVQPPVDEFDNPRQSGSWVTSQTEFDDDDRSTVVDDGSGSYCDGIDEFDDPKQSGGNAVQSTPQTNFENADNQLDVSSQTDVDDDDRSMEVNVGSDSDDSSQHDSDDSSQHSDFSQNSRQSSDEEDGDTLSWQYYF